MSQLEIAPSEKPFRPTVFVDAILPLPLPQLFTYRAPRELEDMVFEGARIVVPFGKSKIMTGIIRHIHNHPPKVYEAKYIIDILDDRPTVNDHQFRFFEWMAAYYMCTIGEVIQAAIPSGLKIDTTSLVQRNPYFIDDDYVLAIEEQLVMEQLSDDAPVEASHLAELVGQKNISRTLKSLLEKEAILIIDHVREKFSSKTKKFIRMTPELVSSEMHLEEAINQHEKKVKQLEVLLAYLREVPVLEDPSTNEEGIAQDELTAMGCSPSSIKTLVEKQILEQFEKEISRFPKITKSNRTVALSKEQETAKNKILEAFGGQKNVLLHGVTGSGKTEIYIDLMREMLDAGHQVLYLLPEIALTAQIVTRLQAVFGNEVGVYHSKYSANERVEVWKKLASGALNFVIGVRSAVFLPFSDLGLVIIDEEHEPSFKQYDPAPRYHARDAALMLAQIHGAKTLLGSATPSLESYYLAQEDKLGYVELMTRYGGAHMPQLQAIDIARAKKKKEVRGNFSHELVEAIGKTLKHDEQVIIFQNRRGYAPFISCDTCGWVPKCIRCDVSLTYHQFSNELRCHYCGYKAPVPSTCGACGSLHLSTVSFGTEQLEEELKSYFPGTEVRRLDLDTTRGKHAYARIIDNFSSGKTRILVGTQMVAKGLDFAHVGLVGIIDLDRMLRFPDFRSVERTFQLTVQVAGRAGRTDNLGNVLIQTYNLAHPVLHSILEQDYKEFYYAEIEERRLFNYPPFTRVIKLIIRDESNQTAAEAALFLYKELTSKLGDKMILGPVVPGIARIRDKHLREIYLKIGRNMKIAAIKKIVRQSITQVNGEKAFKRTGFVVDVDPI